MLLSDLVKANLMPDEMKECRYSYCLNLNKFRILYKVFSLIWNCQHTSPVFSTDTELSNILRVSNGVVVSDWKIVISKDKVIPQAYCSNKKAFIVSNFHIYITF